MAAQSPFKIALIGTSCVGKSTIIKHYQETQRNNPKVAIIHEAARQYFLLNRTLSEEERFRVPPQREIQKLAQHNEIAAVKAGAEILVCDRSVIDAVVYVRGNGDRKGSEQLLKRVKSWIPTYNKMVLLDPVGVSYLTDNVRQEPFEVRQKNHEIFLEVLEETGVPYELVGGSLNERIKRIDTILGL